MKNLILKKVYIENFLSIGKSTLELEDTGFVRISGINNYAEDGATSNGAGKSSGVDAILWVLTGETTRGAKDVVNNKTTGGTKVSLDFSYDGKEYTVTRYKAHSKYGNNLHIIQDGVDISGKGLRDSESILYNTLPDLTSKFLGGVVILGQGLPFRFTNNTPAGRKEVLETLSKSDFIIEDVKNKLNSRKQFLSDKGRKEEDEILSITTTITSNQQTIFRNNITINNIPEVDVSNLEAFKSERQSISEKLDTIKQKIDTNTEEKLSINKQIYEIKRNIDSISFDDNNRKLQEQSKFDNELNRVQSIIDYNRSDLNRINSIKTHCPTCGRPYDNVHKPDTEHIETAIKQHQEYYNKLLLEKKQFLDTFQYTDTSELNNKVKELQCMYSDLDRISKQLNTESTELQSKNSYLNMSIQNMEVSLSTRENQIKTLQESSDRLNKECEELNAKKEQLIKENTDTNARLSCVSQLLTYCSRDFRGYLLSNIIQFVSDYASQYATKLFGSNKLQVLLEGNGISVKYDNKVYECLSGGERQKVDICIQLSIRDMLIQFFGISSNTLFLDELFDGCDAVGCEKLITLIMSLQGISSVFVITHHTDIDIPYDKEIVVVKGEDGISTIQNSKP